VPLRLSFAALLLFACAEGAWAAEVKYRPGGQQFARVWDAFYTDQPHEPELAGPLVAAGPAMTSAICEAVAHKDMMYRRYAIGALGIAGDRRALPTLEKVLKDDSETDYFRGDALQSIFRIDRALGRRFAKQYLNGPDYLARISAAVERGEQWLTAPSRGH
jgi:hypothetical protein